MPEVQPGTPHRPHPVCAEPPATAAEAAPDFAAFARRHPLRILVAEDHPVNRRIIALFLEKLGYAPVHARNGREALAKWTQQRFDLVLMDVHMPEMDGYTCTQEIRAAERTRRGRPPVVICALTADALEGDRERCLAAGMDEHLSKPLDLPRIAQLLAAVHARIGARWPSPTPRRLDTRLP